MKLLLLGDENFTFTPGFLASHPNDSIEIACCLPQDQLKEELKPLIDSLKERGVLVHFGVNPAQMKTLFSEETFDRLVYILPGLAFHGCPEFIDSKSDMFKLRLHLFCFGFLKSVKPAVKMDGYVLFLWPDIEDENVPFSHIEPDKLAKFCCVKRQKSGDVLFDSSAFEDWKPMVHNVIKPSLPEWFNNARYYCFQIDEDSKLEKQARPKKRKFSPLDGSSKGEDGDIKHLDKEGEDSLADVSTADDEESRFDDYNVLKIPPQVFHFNREQLPHVNECFHFKLWGKNSQSIQVSKLTLKYDPRISGWKGDGNHKTGRDGMRGSKLGGRGGRGPLRGHRGIKGDLTGRMLPATVGGFGPMMAGMRPPMGYFGMPGAGGAGGPPPPPPGSYGPPMAAGFGGAPLPLQGGTGLYGSPTGPMMAMPRGAARSPYGLAAAGGLSSVGTGAVGRPLVGANTSALSHIKRGPEALGQGGTVKRPRGPPYANPAAAVGSTADPFSSTEGGSTKASLYAPLGTATTTSSGGLRPSAYLGAADGYSYATATGGQATGTDYGYATPEVTVGGGYGDAYGGYVQAGYDLYSGATAGYDKGSPTAGYDASYYTTTPGAYGGSTVGEDYYGYATGYGPGYGLLSNSGYYDASAAGNTSAGITGDASAVRPGPYSTGYDYSTTAGYDSAYAVGTGDYNKGSSGITGISSYGNEEYLQYDSTRSAAQPSFEASYYGDMYAAQANTFTTANQTPGSAGKAAVTAVSGNSYSQYGRY